MAPSGKTCHRTIYTENQDGGKCYHKEIDKGHQDYKIKGNSPGSTIMAVTTTTPGSKVEVPSSELLQSFKPHYYKMLVVYAPPGKIGVVLGSTVPSVVTIEDTCSIRDKIHVGDKLVAVNGIDVGEMSSIQVVRLVRQKSRQDKRKLTIIRSCKL
eukprot:806097_1